jgi:hypothetical protein
MVTNMSTQQQIDSTYTPTSIEYFDMIEDLYEGRGIHVLNIRDGEYKFSVFMTKDTLEMHVEFMDHIIETDITHMKDFHKYLKDWVISMDDYDSPLPQGGSYKELSPLE